MEFLKFIGGVVLSTVIGASALAFILKTLASWLNPTEPPVSADQQVSNSGVKPSQTAA
jgi:hypothetical protein